ncbi:WD repeat-containing protein 44 isoform X6 [Eurytemora carolleeae]|uniref:WD repeat-containing protein 44 isoform X6 n=1 Tax=Eurytemora carolleeae TaxID=1294199 RepID=UPI000C778758|nr:WD repeat-containing protein 44 isoform X6 [Eurytemora carolleeae]|eukprot:XP_023342371.1 WD repeat-containing protein 44-like isoform X6 [Eurytemora affinis]
MSDDESSESDSFYDAEDTEDTICNSSTRSSGGSRRKSSKNSTLTSPTPAPSLTVGSSGSPVVESQIEILTGDQLSSRDQRWSRLEKLRRREELEREEREEREGRDGSREEPDSTESSVEGIYVSGVRSLHPFKVVEPDSRSLQSGLGSDTKSVARSSLGLDPDSRVSLSLEPEPRSPSVPEPEHRVRFNSESCVLEARSLEKELEKIELTSIPESRVYPEQVRCEEGLPNLIPDIVSSTHPSSPPKPTAPPRRKKRAVGLDDERTRGITAEDRERLFKDTLDFSPDTGVGSSAANFSQDPGVGALGSTETRSSLTKSKSPEEGRRDSLRSRSYRTGGSGGYRTEGHQSGSSGGYHSGGSGGQHSVGRQASGKGSGGSDRRSVAGSIGSGGSDGGIIKQLGMYVRTKSDSGKKLTDQEILQQIKVKNLDTGTEMDLATAEEHLPQSINPLSLHIMRLTSEYTGTLSTSVSMNEGTLYDSDTESILSSISDFEIGQGKKKKTFSKLFGEVAKVCFIIRGGS